MPTSPRASEMGLPTLRASSRANSSWRSRTAAATARIRPARSAFWDQTAHLVADTYVEAVQSTGALALLLPVDGRAPEALLDRIDGLMVIGGADLDPAVYGQERSEHTE